MRTSKSFVNLFIGITSTTTFYFTQTMSTLFYDGPGAGDYMMVTDFWDYVEGPLLDGLYWDKYYNDMELDPHHKGMNLYKTMIITKHLFQNPWAEHLRK